MNGSDQKPQSSKSRSFAAGRSIPESYRALPASLDAEMAALSSILLSPKETLLTVIEKGLNESDFHHPSHGVILAVLLDLWKVSAPIDLVTVTQALADRNLLEQIGGPAVLANLQTFLPTATNAEYYLDIVKEKSLLRQMISVCTSSAARCYEEQGDVKTLIDDVERQIFTVSETRITEKLPNIQDHVNNAIEAIEKLYKTKGQITGVSTGYKVLDDMTTGLHPGEMIVIAARPSMGKTAFAMNIAEHAALDHNKSIGVFSLEMSSQQLVQRLLGSRARVDLQKVRKGFLDKRDSNNLATAAAAYMKSKMYIDDSSGLSIIELRAKSRRLMDRHGLDLIVIDYLQLLKSQTRRAQENRQIEIAEISGSIKALAKELRIPIIILAQLNRESEKRTGGKPRISDLRESGSIEQDADLVGLLYRDAYYAGVPKEAKFSKYARQSKPEPEQEEIIDTTGKAELIIAKQRNGPTGAVPLTFLSEFTRFETRDVSHQEEE